MIELKIKNRQYPIVVIWRISHKVQKKLAVYNKPDMVFFGQDSVVDTQVKDVAYYIQDIEVVRYNSVIVKKKGNEYTFKGSVFLYEALHSGLLYLKSIVMLKGVDHHD